MAEEGRAGDRYRLAAVRDARALNERTKRGDLAAAVGVAREAAARLEVARARSQHAREVLTRAVSARDAIVAAGSSPARIVLAERFVMRRRHELALATAEEVRAEEAHHAHVGSASTARQALARARADREVVERHFAAWRDARRKLAERRAD